MNKLEKLETLILEGEELLLLIYEKKTPGGYGMKNRQETIDDKERHVKWQKLCVLFLIENNYLKESKKFTVNHISKCLHVEKIGILKAVKENSDTQSNENINCRTKQKYDPKKIFIVHGHDEQMMIAVESFMKILDFTPIILNKQVNQGKTVIEKLESYSDVGFTVVLLSPCDFGKSKNEDALKPRARQNVIFELGYFIGKYGRERTCVLIKDEVEEPSDISGIVYIPFDKYDGWHKHLAKEMKSLGYTVDLNKL
jgi:predicted nucleotide-binding protein